ncbi:ABC-type branched-chain amino acid transport system, periplasmic component [Porphyromonas gingivalis AJW4]|uniref:ABC transporter substrate-binding protein n=1 Tax=Porphyromonas gingivalis TaxID=837 RepID=UPI0006AA2E5C|nr:ABC transporter substrate-binding protein [Porphyromonas gingivalis]ALA93289.1 ABC-type branched-chain amino acid transport system, periplasmic component [Porphyromonas gingivalis AJW4]
MNKNRKTLLGLILVALVAVVGYFLWRNAQEKTSEEKEVVKIGVILPLTGDAASYGKALKGGLDLAISDEKRIELVYEDSQGDPKTAVVGANKLLFVDKVDMIVGDMFSNTTLAIAPIVSKQNKLLLTPTASLSSLSDIGTTFRLYPSEKEEAEVLQLFFRRMFSGKKSAILVVNEAPMLKVAEILNESNDKEIITYPRDIVDFSTIIEKLDKNIEVTFLIGYAEECAQIIKKSIQSHRKINFIGLSTLYTPELVKLIGTPVKSLYLSAPSLPLDDSKPRIKEFQEKYFHKYHQDADIWAGYGYDAGEIVKIVLEQAAQNKTTYIDEMYKVKNFIGVTGVITINSDRSIFKTMSIVEYTNGEFKQVPF